VYFFYEILAKPKFHRKNTPPSKESFSPPKAAHN
jgi:hypothetical protein